MKKIKPLPLPHYNQGKASTAGVSEIYVEMSLLEVRDKAGEMGYSAVVVSMPSF